MSLQDDVFDLDSYIKQAVADGHLPEDAETIFDDIVKTMWSYEAQLEAATSKLNNIRSGCRELMDLTMRNL